MARSISVKQKKRGRPATGSDQLVGVRLEAQMITDVDNFSVKEEISRSEAIRRLIEVGLKSASHVEPRKKPTG